MIILFFAPHPGKADVFFVQYGSGKKTSMYDYFKTPEAGAVMIEILKIW